MCYLGASGLGLGVRGLGFGVLTLGMRLRTSKLLGVQGLQGGWSRAWGLGVHDVQF